MHSSKIRAIDLARVKVDDRFWSDRQKLITDVVIPYQEQILDDRIEGVEKSHAFANFRIAAGLEEGEFYGMVFQDSDVAKWLEAVAYSLHLKADPELEKRADGVIEVIEKAQQPDGYLNTYFTIKEPGKRWQNLHECHELYCAGHMMEAAAAYYQVTGKKKLLDIMERMADHIEAIFITGRHPGVPGHQEIEIGLMRMYHTTGKQKFLNLAKHFIDQRGQDPDYFAKETVRRGWSHQGMDPKDTLYNQSYAPVRAQRTADGHSVRAVYMYTAMADLAGETGDSELLQACEAIWDNMVGKRIYLTAGIGSNVEGEAFTIDYDLPNDSVYAETCASVGLIFWAKKMLDMKPSAKYAEVLERALYNGVLSGMQLDGKRFFYVNPLEMNPGVSGELFGYKHVLPQRPGWYACACCPPNVARLITSLGQYLWSESDDILYSHLPIGGWAETAFGQVKVSSRLPWDGEVTYEVYPDGGSREFTLAIRIPDYAAYPQLYINGEEIMFSQQEGYAYIKREWRAQDQLTLHFAMPVRALHTNTAVRANIGCAALMRGPLVYCFEGIDNGERIQELCLPEAGQIRVGDYNRELLQGIVPLEMIGIRRSGGDMLYFEDDLTAAECPMTAVPYYTWGNRGLSQMRVWMHKQ